MTSSAPAIHLASLSKAGPGRLGKGATAIALLVGFILLFSTWIHLEIPQLTGRHIVGRQEFVWTDPLRSETQDR